MSTQQLQLADDLSPRRFGPRVPHAVWKHRDRPTDKEMAETLSLLFEEDLAPRRKASSVFSMPLDIPEPRKLVVTGLQFHSCGHGHLWKCETPSRCVLPYKACCGPCEEKIVASYRAGRYAVAR